MWKRIAVLITLGVVAGVFFLYQTSADPLCNHGEFFNGKSCVRCSTCPPGEGAKRYGCKGTTDTVCNDCIQGETYSSTNNSDDPCLDCVNCHKEFLWVAAPCTIHFNAVCEKCPEGQFFNQSSVDTGNAACTKCSPPCGLGMVEVINCTYKTNRVCINHTQTTAVPPSTELEPQDEVSRPRAKPEYGIISAASVIGAFMIVTCIAVKVYRYLKREREKNQKQKSVDGPKNIGDIPYKDLNPSITKEIEKELRRLTVSCSTGNLISLHAIANKAGLEANNADEFIVKFKKKETSNLQLLREIVSELERENKEKFFLGECIDRAMKMLNNDDE